MYNVCASQHVQVSDLHVCVYLAAIGPTQSLIVQNISVLVVQTQTNNMCVRLTSCSRLIGSS